MKEIVKRLKCDRCNKWVRSSNKFLDTRFYCMNCGSNLGCREIKPDDALEVKNDE